jgi:probable addiction module antidote protein
MTGTRTIPFDPAVFLDDDEVRAAYLSEALETGDVGFIAEALGIVVRAKGVAAVAREADMAREPLNRALSAGGSPTLATVLKVMAALGLTLTARPRSFSPTGEPERSDP